MLGPTGTAVRETGGIDLTRKTIALICVLGIAGAMILASVAASAQAKSNADRPHRRRQHVRVEARPGLVPKVDSALGLKITYGPIGVGGGINAITNRTVDFGASDAPLTPDQFAACKGCVQIPWALSATSIAYQRRRAAEPHPPDRPGRRGHLPRPDQELERPGDQEAEQGQVPSRPGHHGHPPFRQQRHDVQPDRLPEPRQPGLEERSRQGRRRELADRHRRARQRRRLGGAQPDERRHHVRRRRVLPRQPLQVRGDPEPAPASSRSPGSAGSRRRPGRSTASRRTTAASRSSTRPSASRSPTRSARSRT